jgi:hypothetical protein
MAGGGGKNRRYRKTKRSSLISTDDTDQKNSQPGLCQKIFLFGHGDVQAGFKRLKTQNHLKPALNRSANTFFNHALYQG